MEKKPNDDVTSRLRGGARNFWDKIRRGGFPIWYFLLMFALIAAFNSMRLPKVKDIHYSEFKSALAQGEVVRCTIQDTAITGVIKPKPDAKAGDSAQAKPAEYDFRTTRPPELSSTLEQELAAHHVDYKGELPSMWGDLLVWLLPIGLFVLLYFLLFRRLGKAREMVFGFGKSPAKLNVDRKTGVTFADVAGCDEAKFELQEVVDFLKNPEHYRALGAKIPKGVLLVGPPGTGKTLLSRAVAGEANVPFFSMSGSDFVEMFVGVGAARVRDLFQQAKAQAPCIIFIDELDAIGRQRGVHVGAVNDEREQTLNQLLVEMDGFEANAGVIIIGATNRPDVLDRALLRPGRFDRQVVLDAPDLNGREAILRIHSRDKPLADNVDLRRVAQATPGFSGADLANAVNEAALLAARRGAKRISQMDMEEAVEKVVAGPERRSRRLVEEVKKRVAYHEVGHALVAAYSKYADPVHKVSIIPRGRAALGYTMQLPPDDQFLLTRSALLDRIRGMLGGRAAEEIVFREITTGAENDLEHATALVQQMVCMYGMSERVGLVHVGQRQGPVFLTQADGQIQRDCSEETAREIDIEVKRILDEQYAQAKRILSDHRDKLDLVAHELLVRETLDATQFNALLGGPKLPVADSAVHENGVPPGEPHLPEAAIR